MRTLADLHPDDLANRDHLAAELRALRQTAGMSMRDLGNLLGCHRSNINVMERHRAWRFMILAGWARAFDKRITLTITGQPVPDDGDQLADIYAKQQPTSPRAQDLLLLRATTRDLVRIRQQHYTADDVAAHLGCGATAVYWWEDNPDGTSLLMMQRYARAVGCQVVADLAPVGVLEKVAA
ncbi:helix-turn-helix transcriptional regulator [Micromonospora haikouensis]|uniref:helix-turn-helix domain-containing protein n=1 Tax=Micromonospora haikouensis TaxID=686309 RepID=UPI003423DC0D